MHLFTPSNCVYSMDISDALRVLQEGDLLLFSYGDVKGNISRLVCNSWYTHVSIVVERNGRRCIWNTDSRGTQFSPLSRHVMPTRSGEALVVRMLNKPVDSGRVAAYTQQHTSQPYCDDYWVCVYRRWFPYLPLPHTSCSNRFCSMVVINLLASVGVIAHHEDMLPCHFEKLHTINGYNYSPPVIVTSS
jgi:hypothetical protein